MLKYYRSNHFLAIILVNLIMRRVIPIEGYRAKTRSIDRSRFFFFFCSNIEAERTRIEVEEKSTNKIVPYSEISDNDSIDPRLKYRAVIPDINYLYKFFIEQNIRTIRYFNNLLYTYYRVESILSLFAFVINHL